MHTVDNNKTYYPYHAYSIFYAGINNATENTTYAYYKKFFEKEW